MSKDKLDKDTINLLRGFVYEYALERRTSYIGGQSIHTDEINKTNYEKLSGFVNWVEVHKSEKPQPKSQKDKDGS